MLKGKHAIKRLVALFWVVVNHVNFLSHARIRQTSLEMFLFAYEVFSAKVAPATAFVLPTHKERINFLIGLVLTKSFIVTFFQLDHPIIAGSLPV